MRAARIVDLAACLAACVAAGPVAAARGQGAQEEQPLLVHAERLAVPGAAWIRVRFAEAELGAAGRVVLTSELDGGRQVLDAESLAAWRMASAAFNGPAVRLEVLAGPRNEGDERDDEGIFVRVGALDAGEHGGGPPESLCGADDKVPASETRVARLFPIPCTTWRVTNGAFLTAGHCGQWLTDLVQFNVPPSLPDGTPLNSHPDDQYPIDLATVQYVDNGIGDDWAVFGVLPNSNTGLLPHEAYGLGFRATREAPSPGATIRITGFGLDDMPPGTTGFFNADNLTDQTAVGPLLGELTTPVGIQLEYQVDTTSGNSGSPIVWEATGLTIGVHSHLGCDDVLGLGNHGTSFEHDPLEAALAGFLGPFVRHVDVGHPLPVAEDGTLFRPFDTVPEAVLDVPDGGVVAIVAGSYTAAAGNLVTIDRSMTLVAPNGPAVIGE